MPRAAIKMEENQAIECGRLTASLFVIFIHILFPGDLGQIMDCLSRFAVPFFFVVSGFFACWVGEETLLKRGLRIFRLEMTASLIYFLWGCYRERFFYRNSLWLFLKGTFSERKIAQWIFLNENPIAGHLWYLSAAAVCFGILWLYVRMSGEKTVSYTPLYIVGVCLYGFQIAFGTYAAAIGQEVWNTFYRNGLFFGLPMFLLGIFLREYQQRIKAAFRLTNGKLIVIILVCALLNILQWRGFGRTEMPLATLPETIALMLLLWWNPRVSGNQTLKKIISKFGRLSLCVYILHPLLYQLYLCYGQRHILAYFPQAEGYMQPLMIGAVSLGMGVLYELFLYFVGWMKAKTAV